MNAPDVEITDDCDHEGWELKEDEHLANCLYDPDAARRIEEYESRWDSQGISGCGL